ncbi:hypothetical protein D3C80_1737550 [compost metagenome]
MQHFWHDRLHRGDVLAHPFVVLVPIDAPRRTHHQQAKLLQFDPRIGNFFLDHLLVRQAAALGTARQGPLTECVKGFLRLTDHPHGVVHATTTEPHLSHDKCLAGRTEHVARRHSHLVE